MKFLLFLVVSASIFQAISCELFDSDAQKAILKAHNDLRSKIAKGEYTSKGFKVPSATNMLKMRWNSTVADSANEWVETGLKAQCRLFHQEGGPYAENLAMHGVSEYPDLAKHGVAGCGQWEEEFQKYQWKDFDWQQEKYGHAATMAWSTNEFIGCGYVKCKDWFIVGCRYSYGSHWPDGKKAFKPGKTCSECPEGYVCEEGLCADPNGKLGKTILISVALFLFLQLIIV